MKQNDGEQQIPVMILTDEADSVKSFCTRYGALSHASGKLGNQTIILSDLKKAQIDQLAKLSMISAIELVRTPHTDLKQEGLDLGLNAIKKLQHLRPELTGASSTISIKEYAFDTADIDFKNRFFKTSRSPERIETHATHMATIAAGGGNSDPTAKGVAWDAHLTSSNFESLLPDPDLYFIEHDVTLQNHSYGTGIENYYGIETAAYDDMTSRLPWMNHIFSSGNSGMDTPEDGLYQGLQGWANLTGQFKQSKNTITVGATDSLGNVIPMSSKGPAYDGRIKPEVVAFGQGGTSGAAALVSGLCALLDESFRNLHGDAHPPASLIKAILINSSMDIGRPGPDFENGFGLIQGWDAVKAMEEGHYLSMEVMQDDTIRIPLELSEPLTQLKITLCWNDPAAPISAPKALVNNLDLRLLNLTTHETVLPWVLHTRPFADSLILPAYRADDTLNPVEQISLGHPVQGQYEIQIYGRQIHSTAQSFSIVWEQELPITIAWVFPTGSDHLEPGRRQWLRWTSNTPQNGAVDYTYVGEGQWHRIAEEIESSQNMLSWTPPLKAGLVQLRWITSDSVYLSDTFTISTPLRPKLGFVCGDSMRIQWPPDAVAEHYKILRLGDQHLEPFDVTTDSFFIVKDLDNSHFHYSVAPIYQGYTGPASYAFDYRTQGTGCYLNSFFLRYVKDGFAYFEVNLSTWENLTTVRLEQRIGDLYHPIQTFSPGPELTLFPEAHDLHSGPNDFRVVAVLENGQEVISEIVTAYDLRDQPVLVYPNPVPFGSDVTILTETGDLVSVQIVNELGQVLLTWPDPVNPQLLSLSGLPPGYYAVVIRYASGDTHSTGFIIAE